MKALPITILTVSLLASFVFWGGYKAGFWFFITWVALPYLFSIIISALNLKGVFFKRTIPIAGAIAGVLALPLYYETYSYKGSDGQVGLIFAVMPVYQFVLIGIICVVTYIVRRFFLN